MTIKSDSSVNVEAYLAGRDVCRRSANCDLSQDIFEILDGGGTRLALVWIKGHATARHVVRHKLALEDVCGNYAADALAESAASSAEVAPQDVSTLLWYHSLARRIQCRGIAIVRAVCRSSADTANNRARGSSVEVPRPMSVVGLALASQPQGSLPLGVLGASLHNGCHVFDQ